MQGNVNIPDSTITSALTFRNLVLMNMQQLTNFPYIEKDFDALTDYELLSLVVKYLNDVIANQNEQNDSITRMYESFLALQTYVNNTKDTLEDAFNTLDNYVRTFFENLDVQDEIDHKLDEMVEDGTLEHIIASYLQTQKIYNTHVEMVADTTNLVDGLTVQTLGYSVINDGGGAFYKITSTEPSGTYYETLGESLYALLIKTSEYLDVRQLGILPNTETIQSVPLYNAFLTANQMGLITYIPKGTYIVKAKEIEPTQGEEDYSFALVIPENSEVYFEKGSIIKLINDADAWSRVVAPKSNVTIHGELTIDGSCDTVTSGNEHMSGLFVYDEENIYIENLHSYNCYGDNVQLSGTLEKTKPIIINNLKCEKAGRKNLVFESGNVHIHNALLDNRYGNVNNNWEGGNSLDVEPFTLTTYKSLKIDRFESFGTGNDVTSGTTEEQIKTCQLYFDTFIQHGGELLSYGITAYVNNLILYNVYFNISYSANWNIDNLIFYNQQKRFLQAAAAGSPAQIPNININNMKVYGAANEYSEDGMNIRSANGTIKNLYIENYFQRTIYFYAATNIDTSFFIDNAIFKNCGFAGTSDTNMIINTGYYTGNSHNILFNNISVFDNRGENTPSTIIKMIGEDENKYFYANNIFNNTSYQTLTTRYGNFVPVLQLGGTTTQRPSIVYNGIKYYDTTLGKYITHNGTNWINLDGTSLS